MVKYKCLTPITSSFTKNKIYEMDFLQNDNMFVVKNDTNDYVTIFPHILNKYFEKVKEEPKTYYGDEILKMIREGELKEDAILISISKGGTGTVNMFGQFTFNQFKEFEPFEIFVEKEYITFDEARKSGKKFKHKDMKKYHGSIYSVFEELVDLGNIKINQMLDEKAWEAED
jgi:hypothetical protein